MLRDVRRDDHVAIGYIEQNGFQRWLPAELEKYPETKGKIVGHNTGLEKINAIDGVPSLKIALAAGRWSGSLPSGDKESAEYAAVFRTEAAAFGWRDGKLQGLGEHDDTIMSWWLADRAARFVKDTFINNQGPEIVTMEDLGIEPVKIGPDI